MDVILLEKVANLGNLGDRVAVRSGYARNFLLPKGHAMKASDGAASQAVAMRRARDLRDAHDRESAQTVASALVAKTINIPVKAGAEGRLFGSVTASDVAAAVEAQAGIVLDRRKLHVDHIKTTGTYQVSAKLHHDVEFPITIEVVAK